MDDIFSGSLKSYIDKVASSASTPGGGSVIAAVNSLAASLMLMSLRIAILKKENPPKEALDLEKELMDIKEESLELAEADSREFKKVMKNWSKGGELLEESLKRAAEVSLNISLKSLELIELIDAQDLNAYKNIITDVAIAFYLGESSFRGGIANSVINAKLLSREENKTEIFKRQKNIEKNFKGLADKLKGRFDAIIKR
ncbi:MAG: cyclodeaminase/cyclohydrolase family protein [Elusimicrobiota bacterium]|nr:cyclodeaminase/cyclohydrolase family protein [Elusimicrobiota bacterium]